MDRQQTSRTPALLFALVLSPMLFADTGGIATIAGNGTFGSAGTGGPAVNAQLGPAFGIAVDAADNLFIADARNNRIVRVDAVTGILTLAAGNGAAFSSGDGGPAALASINYPFAVALDGAGNLYIAEYGGSRIRRVDAQTGIITTVAGTGSQGFSGDGGPATGATLFLPAGIALDPNRNLYIADSGNSRVRRVDAQTGIIATVAGNGSNTVTADGVAAAGASLSHPMWVAFDGSGGLLISESGGNRIRRVDPLTGILTTIAGNGDPNFTGDGVAATSAGIGGPLALLADPAGNLFFVDGTGRVRRVDASTGVITTVAGNGSGPHGITSASAGGSGGGGGGGPVCNTVAGDYGPATSATLDGPLGVQLTRNGNLLVSDALDCRVRRVYLPSSNPYTNTTLTASATILQGGQAVLLTATVSPIGASGVPTGSIQFVNAPQFMSPTILGTAALNGGTASLGVNTLSQGDNQVLAYYSGDAALNSSGSPGIPISVSGAPKAIATVTLSANQTPSAVGATTIFTATVTPPAGDTTALSGPVLLCDGSALVVIANLVNGIATLPAVFRTPGNHAMTAIYLGDNNYSQVLSATLAQPVNGTASSAVSIVSSAPNSTYGQAIQVTISVLPSSATGTIQLVVDQSPIPGSGQLINGAVIAQPYPPLAAGTHTITAIYSGDGNNPPATSAPFTQNVAKATPSFTVTSSPNPSAAGQAVTLTVTMTPVSNGAGLALGIGNPPATLNATWSAGRTSIITADLSIGTHTVTGTWGGDANVLAGSSAVLIQTVQANPTTTSVTLTSSANPSIAGRPLWFTATVSPATATGTVQFRDGATALGTATIAGGWATLPLSTLPVGTHSITAVYSGDVNDLASTSAAMAEAIAPASPPVVEPGIITTLVGSPNGCGPGVPNCGIGHPVADAAGNIYFQDGYQILTRSPDGVTSTIAGNGQPGVSGDGGPALSASLGVVGQLAIHGGRVCFGEPSAHKIRCLEPGTGLIQGYGTGIQNSGGDGGNVSNASFDFPVGAAFDDAGNLYISDSSRNNVRRIDAVTSIVTLFAGPGPGYSGAPLGDGGPAVGANLLQPGSLSYYNGGIYIADGNGRIRRVDLATGMILSVATASASYIATDPSGNLFYTSAQTVNMMDPSGNVSAIADANSYSGIGSDDILATNTIFGGIVGLGWDPLAQRLLIADQSRLRQIFFTPPTTTALTLSPNPVAPGGQVTLEATVSPATATGSVRFYQDNVLLGSEPLVNSVAEITWTAPIGGNSTAGMRAVYGGDANDNLSMSATLTETAQQGTTASTSSLTASPNASILGGSVTLSVTVSPATATGAVAFYSNGAIVGTATVVSGQAQLSLASLPAGSSLLMARYGGDLTYAGSTSNVVTQMVASAPSGVALTSSANPSIAGQPLTLTAAISPATATGTVQFLDGATVLGTVAVTGGSAALALSTLTADTHSITAVYSGDANNPGGASAALAQTVNKLATSVALTYSANPSPLGQSLTLTATLSPNSATGTIQFLDGSTVLGTVTVSGGSAAFSTSSLTAGGHSIGAAYSGDGNYLATITGAGIQVKPVTTMSLSVLPNPPLAGQAVTLTAVLSPSAASGTVSFLDWSGAPLGSVVLSGGRATLLVSPQTFAYSAGPQKIQVNYSGDATYMFGTAVLTMTVSHAPTSVALASSMNPSTSGQSVRFTAAVSPASAGGAVQFLDGPNVLGTAAISGGSATLSLSTLSAGTHSITASYSGDANNAASASSVLTQTVGLAVPQPVLVTPSGGTGNPGAFTFVFSDTDGWTSILSTMILFNSSLAFPNACHVVYEPGNNRFFLADDGETKYLGPVTLGALQIVENSQCRISGAGSSAVGMGTSLTLTLAVSFKAPFVGAKNIYLEAQNYYIQSAWQQTGSWTITAPHAPAAPSAPSPGNGTSGAPISPVLSWTAGAGSAWSDVYFGTVPDPPFAVSTTAAIYSPGTLTPGTKYYWRTIATAASGATSSPVWSFTTAPAITSVALNSSLNPAVMGQSVAFTAAVSPNTAAGTVQFLDGTKVLGTATISGGSAVLAVSSLTAGTHSIKAVYSGDSKDMASTSALLTQTVSAPPPGAPANLTAQAESSREIDLNWKASPTHGVTYDIYSAATPGFMPAASNRIASGITAVSYSNTGLPPSTSRYYLVTALSSSGESAPANQASATTRR
jgi:sugar lactone lactonase YvrE